MKNNSKTEPTPVMIAATKDSKKNREIKHNNLQVLINTVSSHSLINKNIAQRAKEKKILNNIPLRVEH